MSRIRNTRAKKLLAAIEGGEYINSDVGEIWIHHTREHRVELIEEALNEHKT